MVNTYTPTITSTPTVTPTPAVIGVVIGLPWPNPVKGTGPVTIQIQAPSGSTPEGDVFTTAFRKVRHIPNSVQEENMALVWNLDDDGGSPVANGLYYLRVQVKGRVKASKILKILVTR